MEASKLKEILDQHKLWIETNGKQGEYAYLKDVDLKDVDLRGAKLSGANLTYADLKGADLKGAALKGAALSVANLTGADLYCTELTSANLTNANLYGANLTGADLSGANLTNAILTGTIGLPHISWVIPGCLSYLNKITHNGFYLIKERKWVNFVQDSLGFFIQNNLEEGTFDMLLGDRIIRGIPDWVKYTALKQIESI